MSLLAAERTKLGDLAHGVRNAPAARRRLHDVRAAPTPVEDDGVGFPPQQRSEGIGLIGIRERVRALGGRLELRPGPGARLSVRVPLERGRGAGTSPQGDAA